MCERNFTLGFSHLDNRLALLQHPWMLTKSLHAGKRRVFVPTDNSYRILFLINLLQG